MLDSQVLYPIRWIGGLHWATVLGTVVDHLSIWTLLTGQPDIHIIIEEELGESSVSKHQSQLIGTAIEGVNVVKCRVLIVHSDENCVREKVVHHDYSFHHWLVADDDTGGFVGGDGGLEQFEMV
ncbi:hypothetical protein GCK72_008265 [Caenorhabditis remanei]|uniref:Uncharacterized protein n=1 Tax=Caenorhabditis remanei TaxID=31234 RepID=A0A6A5GZ99_CAERE|nr:hypothetical protein GCK72_008265 [Caenorhabditis remanei]KAF1760019.1 hypothetical protein GCK72_008265 [Caenorhabditis remanei]